MPLSPADINLGKHERRHLPAFRPTHRPGVASSTRWRSYSDRREPTSETTIDYPQQVPPESPQSDNPGSYPPWLLVFVHASKTHCQIINHHQAIYPALFPRCIEEAKVLSALFSSWRQEARPEGTITGSHQRYR